MAAAARAQHAARFASESLSARRAWARGDNRAPARRARRAQRARAAGGADGRAAPRRPSDVVPPPGSPAAGAPRPPRRPRRPRRAVGRRRRPPAAVGEGGAQCGRPADAAPLAAGRPGTPLAPGAPPPPTPAPRMARMVPRAPPSQSKVCVAAKKLTSTAATRSAAVRTNSRRSVGATRRQVIGSPSRSLHSRSDRTEGASPAPPPAMSTLCSRTTPSANPTHSRRPVRSKAMAVAATPGADATAATTGRCARRRRRGVLGGPEPDAAVARAGGEHARGRGVPRRERTRTRAARRRRARSPRLAADVSPSRARGRAPRRRRWR